MNTDMKTNVYITIGKNLETSACDKVDSIFPEVREVRDTTMMIRPSVPRRKSTTDVPTYFITPFLEVLDPSARKITEEMKRMMEIIGNTEIHEKLLNVISTPVLR